MSDTETPKYTWYQTDTHIVIEVLVKKVKKDDVTVVFGYHEVTLNVSPPSDTHYRLNLILQHDISLESCSYKVTSSKIEIKLQKKSSVSWTSLEKSTQLKEQKPVNSKNWDAIVGKLTEDDTRVNASDSVSELFQKIYMNGTDEVKKAMDKSFYESGGTVLSTNWQQVEKNKVDVKEPEGVEFKKWS